MADTVRANILVSGRVQGVFYRSSAMQEAQRLGIQGFIQNLPDGAVEAVVEGAEDAVEQFVVWCRSGPPSAQVEGVRVRFSPPRGEFRTFSIVR
jgi:acylphosphatase